MWKWISRCVPGLSLLALLTLLVLAFPETVSWIHFSWSGKEPSGPFHHGNDDWQARQATLSLAQKIFIGYTVFVHGNAFTFSLRLAWALSQMVRQTRAVLGRRPLTKKFHGSAGSDSPVFAESPTDTPDPMSFDLGALEGGEQGEVVHAIILPNYSEDLDTLETTLKVLASHPRAATQYEVFLAMEQKELKAPEKAVTLISTFQGHFKDICSTFHPSGLAGEISGKSSNVAWAAKHIVQTRRSDDHAVDFGDVIITVMDADTHLTQDYFNEIRRLHWLHNKDADHALYASPIIFDRNSNDVPTLVRCADLLWGFAGISAMYPGCPIVIPTSVYSLSLALAEKVGGWDGDATAIGEDMHMLLKCYFETGGDVVTHIIYSPASQCNIQSSGDGNWGPYTSTLFARYRQALRHMWGALDTGYSVRQSVGGISSRPYLSFKFRHIALGHLLFEAHFLPCHLTILLIFSSLYTSCFPSSEMNPALEWAFFITGFLRGVSFVGMNLCITLYDRWYSLCVNSRARDMSRAGLSDTGLSFRVWYRPKQLAERICFPIAGTVFGSIPAIQAEMSHFWTDRLVYRVSKKPSFVSSPSPSFSSPGSPLAFPV